MKKFLLFFLLFLSTTFLVGCDLTGQTEQENKVLKGTILGLQEQISGLNNYISGLNEQISGLNDKIRGLVTEINKLNKEEYNSPIEIQNNNTFSIKSIKGSFTLPKGWSFVLNNKNSASKLKTPYKDKYNNDVFLKISTISSENLFCGEVTKDMLGDFFFSKTLKNNATILGIGSMDSTTSYVYYIKKDNKSCAQSLYTFFDSESLPLDKQCNDECKSTWRPSFKDSKEAVSNMNTMFSSYKF